MLRSFFAFIIRCFGFVLFDNLNFKTHLNRGKVIKLFYHINFIPRNKKTFCSLFSLSLPSQQRFRVGFPFYYSDAFASLRRRMKVYFVVKNKMHRFKFSSDRWEKRAIQQNDKRDCSKYNSLEWSFTLWLLKATFSLRVCRDFILNSFARRNCWCKV